MQSSPPPPSPMHVCVWMWVGTCMCEVTFSLTTHFPHSVPGRKKKGDGHKDLDVCYKVASENECLITDIHKPEQPLSKIELRRRKLETRKKRNLKCIEEIQDGKWLKDSHITRASDLLMTRPSFRLFWGCMTQYLKKIFLFLLLKLHLCRFCTQVVATGSRLKV